MPSKYTNEELSEMAKLFLQDYNEGGTKSLMVVNIMGMLFNLDHDEVVNRIKELKDAR